MMRRGPLVSAGLGIALLLAAWIGATRPFAAPDESSHYLRALDIANGQLVGPRVSLPPDPAIPAAQQAWSQRDTRGVVVAGQLSPPGVPCVNGDTPAAGRSCLEPTHTGDYHPLPYLLPALALLVAHSESTGLWLSRAVSAFACLMFVLVALALLWDGSALSLLGVLVAVTPTGLFVASVINPNGLEIASTLAFAAALLRITRSPARSPAWIWAVLMISAAVAVLSWQLGFVFVLVTLALIGGTFGRTGWDELRTTRGKELRITALTVIAALVVYLAYGLSSGVFHSSFTPLPIVHSLRLGLDQLRGVARESVAAFGAESIYLSSASYWIWWLLVLALLGCAIRFGNRRDRTMVSLAMLLAVAFPVLFYAWIYRSTGFSLQGRYVLPVLVLVPLVAGEVTRRHQDGLPAWLVRWLPRLVIGIVAGFQLFAWDTAARTAAGRRDTVWFLSHPTWSPPGGWWVWTTLSVLGTAALLVSAIWRPGSLTSDAAPRHSGAVATTGRWAG